MQKNFFAESPYRSLLLIVLQLLLEGSAMAADQGTDKDIWRLVALSDIVCAGRVICIHQREDDGGSALVGSRPAVEEVTVLLRVRINDLLKAPLNFGSNCASEPDVAQEPQDPTEVSLSVRISISDKETRKMILSLSPCGGTKLIFLSRPETDEEPFYLASAEGSIMDANAEELKRVALEVERQRDMRKEDIFRFSEKHVSPSKRRKARDCIGKIIQGEDIQKHCFQLEKLGPKALPIIIRAIIEENVSLDASLSFVNNPSIVAWESLYHKKIVSARDALHVVAALIANDIGYASPYRPPNTERWMAYLMNIDDVLSELDSVAYVQKILPPTIDESRDLETFILRAQESYASDGSDSKPKL